MKFVPDFSFIFFDIARQNIEEISKIENLFLKSAISIQNLKSDSRAALVNFFKIKRSFDKYEDRRNYFRIIAVYFYATFSLNKEEIMNLIQENMLSDIEISNDEFISTYDMIMEETAQKFNPIIKEKDRIIALKDQALVQKDQVLVQKDQALELQKFNAIIKAFQKNIKIEEIADLLSISTSEVNEILKKNKLV